MAIRPTIHPEMNFPRLVVFTLFAASAFAVQAAPSEPVKPIRALLVTGGGGGYHDYKAQKKILTEGISARANVVWTVVHEDGSLAHEMRLFSDPNWARDYDVIVHNTCFSEVKDPAAVARVLRPHREGKPAVLLHATMHTYMKLPTDEWREFVGVVSDRHGPQQPVALKNIAPEHPVMRGFPGDWVTGNEELYAIDRVMPGVTPLARAYATDNKRDHAVIWAHTYGNARVFATSLAHNNATFSDTRFLDTMARGLLWSCGKLDASGRPLPGYAAVTAPASDSKKTPVAPARVETAAPASPR